MPRGDGLVGRRLDGPELGQRGRSAAHVQQDAPTAGGVRRECALRGLAVAEPVVLDEDRLRALQEVGGKTIDGVLPPDPDERAAAGHAPEPYPRDAVIL